MIGTLKLYRSNQGENISLSLFKKKMTTTGPVVVKFDRCWPCCFMGKKKKTMFLWCHWHWAKCIGVLAWLYNKSIEKFNRQAFAHTTSSVLGHSAVNLTVKWKSSLMVNVTRKPWRNQYWLGFTGGRVLLRVFVVCRQAQGPLRGHQEVLGGLWGASGGLRGIPGGSRTF